MEYNGSVYTVPTLLQNNLHWTWIVIVETVVLATIILFTVVGNGLVLAAILNTKTLRSPTYIFVGNLALADLLVGTLILPCNATVQITRKWYFGTAYCTIWHCLHLWLCSASILSICAICLDRFVGVSYPLKHFRLMRGHVVKEIIACVWIISFCLGVFPVFVWPEPPSGDAHVCKINQQFGLVMVVTVGIFYLPLTVMLVLYCKIFWVAKRHWDLLRTGTGTEFDSTLRIHIGRGTGCEVKEGSNSPKSSTASTESLLASNLSRQTTAAKKLIVVVGTFIVCYFPFFTVFLMESLNPTSVSPAVFEALAWLRYSNSAINPVIYAAMLPAFRKGIQPLFEFKTNITVIFTKGAKHPRFW